MCSLKNFTGVMCPVAFLALGLIFNFLVGNTRLNFMFQELFPAFKESTYSNYCLASELCCKPARFVTVAETLQLRWEAGGGLHMGMNHLVLVCVVPPSHPTSYLMLLNLLCRITRSWCLLKKNVFPFGTLMLSGSHMSSV